MEELSNPIEQTENDWQIGQKLGTCMLHLYTNNIWTDVTFRCQGHVEDDKADRIHAHKIVLAARSPFFQGMFFGQCSESKAEFDLLTTESDTLDLVLRYIYSDETTLKENTAPKIMELAHLYQISGLVDYCARYLTTCLRPDNACEILDLASLFNLTELKDAARVSIDDNARQILDSDSFFRISNTCLTYILKGDTFYMDETYVFDKVIEWAERQCSKNNEALNGTTKRNTLGEAFYFLRLPTLSNQEFLKCVKGKGFYTMQEMENIFETINNRESDVVPCHRVVNRVERRICVDVPSCLEETYLLHQIEIECVLRANVSRDCAISGFCLQNVEPFLLQKEDTPLRFGRTSDAPYNKDTTVEIPLDCTFYVEDVKFEKSFHVNQQKSMAVDLPESLHLSKRDTPYTLKFGMKYSCDDLNIRFGAIMDTATSQTENNDACSNTDISLHYISRYVNCIKSIHIENYSNRNPEDACVDLSDI